MRETANERLVREVAREVAQEAMRRIRTRLLEVEAEPMAGRLYEAEWGAMDRDWPTAAMPGRDWVPFLLEDLSRAKAALDGCRHY
jgi:hypothetical protein